MSNPTKIGDHPSDTPYPVEEHTVTAAGLKLYYHTAGNPNNPPLVFLHGWGIRWNKFGPWKGIKPVVEEFSHHFYVIAPELPGLIRSEAPKSYRGYEEYARIIHALVKTLGIDQPIYLTGSSFGGTIATLYAKDYPQDVKHLILINAILSFQPGKDYPKWLEWWGKAYQTILSSNRMPTFAKKLIVHFFFGTPWKQINKEDLARKKNLDDPLLYVYDMDYDRIRVPVLLVWGEKDTKVPVKKAQDMANKIQDSKLVTVPGGHTTLYFHPKKVVHTAIKNLPINQNA